MADSRYFVDIFSEIVDSMRATGTITDSSEASTIYTITTVNSLSEGDSVKINSIDYITSSVTSTSFKITAATGLDFTDETWQALAPYYIYGHPREIAMRLSNKKGAVDKFRKFPLIALFQDFQESHGSENYNIDYALPFTIVIVYKTDKTYVSETRYTNVFKPILYPIYENLLKKIDDSPYILTESLETIDHTKTDRLYWGVEGVYSSEGLIFNENLDAIQVDFEGLNVIRNTEVECQ